MKLTTSAASVSRESLPCTDPQFIVYCHEACAMSGCLILGNGSYKSIKNWVLIRAQIQRHIDVPLLEMTLVWLLTADLATKPEKVRFTGQWM